MIRYNYISCIIWSIWDKLLNFTQFSGPAIFNFTSQPVSQSVSTGGSVTLNCVATGRTSITYTWYRLDEDFKIPPGDTDIYSDEVGTTLTVAASDILNDNDKRMFQCKATSSENETLFSNVATVEYAIAG